MLWLDLDLTEVGVHGPAQVTAIEPCPEIEAGEGRLVTGTFHYSAGILCDLQIEDEEEALGVTGTHPFWSQHRHKWVEAQTLVPGERLRAWEVAPKVIALNATESREPVYNIEY